MIQINDLKFKYESEYILNGLNLSINDGDFIAIVGPNGTGKSTFIKCLIGINKVGHNQILIDDVCISCFNKYHLIGYVPQVDNQHIELPISPREYFSLISKDKTRINNVASDLQITDLLDLNFNDLSGGQKQRVNIAKALLNDISYLIMDEPTAGLDVQSRDSLYELLDVLNARKITIIIVSHNLDEISESVSSIFSIASNSYIGGYNASI